MIAYSGDKKNIQVTWFTTKDVHIATHTAPTGGQFYEFYLEKILDKNFNLRLVYLSKRKHGNTMKKTLHWFKFKKSLQKLNSIPINSIALMNSSIASFFPFNAYQKSILLVHHMGLKHEKLFDKFFYGKYLDRRFYRNLIKIDKIVTVSKFWADFFRHKNHPNVKIIYNSFDLSNFYFQKNEITKFKDKYGLKKKPIIYLGSWKENKGIEKAYDNLKSLDAFFITTGRKAADFPTIHLELEYRDYLRLLKASDIVVLMSEFEEGWNRIAHEAMLCQTPVIGSGKGGMKELLEGGGQIVSSFNELQINVKHLLENAQRRITLGKNGYNFAKNFNLEYFENEWVNLIYELAK